MDEAEYLKAIGKQLRKLRKLKAISLRELELRGDVSRHIISEIEHGKRDIRITTLKKILHALNASEKEFWNDFNLDVGHDPEDIIADHIKKIVSVLPVHNDIVLLRNLLQAMADRLAADPSLNELSEFLLRQRMELHDCLNQEGLLPDQENVFLEIKKRILTRLNAEQNRLQNQQSGQ